MSSENTVKLETMQSSDHATAAGGGGEILHTHPWLPDRRDEFISWLRAEFAAANAIIDSLCHHLRCVGEPGEYETVIECVLQRRVTWNHVLHLQQFFQCKEIMRALQQVESRKQQRVVDVTQGKVGGEEFGRSFVLDFGSRKVHRAVVNGRSHGVDCRSLNVSAPIVEDRAVKERRDVPNATVDGSLVTSRNPDGAKIHHKESQLKDVKVEKTIDSEACCDHIIVTEDDHTIQNQNEESLTISPKTLRAVETSDGNTVNVAEGSYIYEGLLNQADNSMHISPVNDLRATRQHEQIPAIDSRYDVPYSGDYDANDFKSFPSPAAESRTKWSRDEELLLIKAWLNTDKVAATNQKPKLFWKRVTDYYRKQKPDIWVERELNLCRCKWRRITGPVSKFASLYEEAYKQKASDQSEDDVIRKAHQLYYNAIGDYFKLDHAWRALRSEFKWRYMYLKVKANDINEDSGCSAERKKKKKIR